MVDIPKIDLHCHFDGSIPPEVLCDLASSRNIEIPGGSLEGYRLYLKETKNCKSLVEYLERFDFPIAILQDEEAIIKCMEALIENLDKQGLVYCEIRFAPQHHTKQGLSQEDVLKALLQAIKNKKDSCKIHIELICCMMNFGDVTLNEKQNWETIDLVEKYLHRGVVLLDIAGAEGKNMLDFEKFFIRAREKNIPFIIHAGEAGDSNNVRLALEFGALRIGHGVRSIENLDVVQELIDTKTPIEVCISSNIDCFVFNLEQHPIKKLKDAGVMITINTDNMMFSNTTLDHEYELLMNGFGITRQELIDFNLNSLHAAACDDVIKQRLSKLF